MSFLYLQVFHFSETAYNWLQEMASAAEERDEEAQEYHVDLSILEDKGHWKSFLNLGLCVDEESECLMRYESGVKCLEDAKLKESGELFLTNLRLAFRGSKSKEVIDMPFLKMIDVSSHSPDNSLDAQKLINVTLKGQGTRVIYQFLVKKNKYWVAWASRLLTAHQKPAQGADRLLSIMNQHLATNKKAISQTKNKTELWSDGDCEGTLTIGTDGFLGFNLKKRYVILKNNMLYCFSSKNSSKPTTMIYVKECVIEGQKIENSFQIYNEHKVYLVFTETAEEKKMWFEALSKVAKKKGTVTKPPTTLEYSGPNLLETDSPYVVGALGYRPLP